MQQIGTQPIETERLLLRRFEEADAEAMFANWATDPRVTLWLRWEPHTDVEASRAMIREWVKSYEDDSTYLWAMTLKDTGEVIGSIGILHGVEPEFADHWEPGYCMGHAFWGQGYTSEALQAIVGYFVEGTGQDDLICCHARQNPASGRVMEKAGFVYTHDGVYHKPDGSVIEARYYKYMP